MTLPRSVQDQIDRAAQIQQDLNKPAGPENPADAAPQEQAPKEPVTPQPAKPVQSEPDEIDGKPASYWKHRFDVLQGKYNAEVPALRKEVSELQHQIQQAAKPDGSAVERAQTAVADLTKEEIEEFGPELVNLIHRVAGSVAKSSVPADTGEIQQIRQELQAYKDEKQQDAEATFWSSLEQQVPDYRQINADPAFHGWLAEIDPFSGLQRQQLLAQAQQALSASRVIALFNTFKQGAKAPQVPDSQVIPRSTGGGYETQPVSQAKVWTRAEISAFYRDKAAGRYPADEAKAIEADIFAAQSEGRIR